MFKFQLPITKWTDLFPKETQAPTAVRTYISTIQPIPETSKGDLEIEGRRILQQNAGQIMQFYKSQRQAYDLSSNEYQRTSIQLQKMRMSMSVNQGQEIVTLEIFPTLGGSEDRLCLMVIYSGDSVAAFDMESLDSKTFSPLYNEKFKNSSSFYQYEKLYAVQFKPTYADAVICSTVKFSEVPAISTSSPFLNAILGFAAISTPGGEFSLRNPVVVWSGENIYTPEGTYQLKDGSFELVEPTPYPGITPYAISMEGVYYYEPRIFTSYTYISLDSGFPYVEPEAPAEHSTNIQQAYNSLPEPREDVMITSIFDSKMKTTVKIAYNTEFTDVTDLTFQVPLLTISQEGELGFELNTVNGYALGVGNKTVGAVDTTIFSYLNESYSGTTPLNGPQKDGLWGFIPFPYALSSTEYYFAVETYTYGASYSAVKQFKTPYEMFDGSQYNLFNFVGWMQLTNNTYVVQAYVFFLDEPSAIVRIYSNGERIDEALADSLGITPNQINAIYMDVPLSTIKKF